jgi:tRNA-dihydrouridine synthase 1
VIIVCSVRAVVQEAYEYESGAKRFVFDPQKQKRAKEAAARKKAEEGKRKAFEERMVRKAKREGKSDPMFYLNSGAENPTLEQLEALRSMTKEEAFGVWKERYSQHCFAFHFNEGGCSRDRKCAFLHADARIGEAVAYG